MSLTTRRQDALVGLEHHLAQAGYPAAAQEAPDRVALEPDSDLPVGRVGRLVHGQDRQVGQVDYPAHLAGLVGCQVAVPVLQGDRVEYPEAVNVRVGYQAVGLDRPDALVDPADPARADYRERAHDHQHALLVGHGAVNSLKRMNTMRTRASPCAQEVYRVVDHALVDCLVPGLDRLPAQGGYLGEGHVRVDYLVRVLVRQHALVGEYPVADPDRPVVLVACLAQRPACQDALVDYQGQALDRLAVPADYLAVAHDLLGLVMRLKTKKRSPCVRGDYLGEGHALVDYPVQGQDRLHVQGDCQERPVGHVPADYPVVDLERRRDLVGHPAQGPDHPVALVGYLAAGLVLLHVLGACQVPRQAHRHAQAACLAAGLVLLHVLVGCQAVGLAHQHAQVACLAVDLVHQHGLVGYRAPSPDHRHGLAACQDNLARQVASVCLVARLECHAQVGYHPAH